eukprot:1371967-Ditylum_brightwellii.AAC.1
MALRHKPLPVVDRSAKLTIKPTTSLAVEITYGDAAGHSIPIPTPKGSLQDGKSGCSATFAFNEVCHLINIIRCCLTLSDAGWDKVLTEHNTMYEEQQNDKSEMSTRNSTDKEIELLKLPLACRA